MQNEMNLHNLNTKLSEQLYYLGAFLLLVVLPVVYKMCKRALGWLRLSSLAVFLPAVWLPVPFAVTFGFIGAGRMVWPYVFGMMIVALVLLGVYLGSQVRSRAKSIDKLLVIATISITSWALYQCNYFNYDEAGVRAWMMTKWSEMFIALGILSTRLAFLKMCTK